MGWDDADKLAEETGGEGNLYLRLEPSQKAVLAFIGEPLAFRRQWTGSAYEAVETGGSFSFMFTVWDRDTPHSLKVLNAGKAVYESIVRMKNKYGLRGRFFELERKGSGLDTEYFLMPDESDVKPHAADIKAACAEMPDLQRLVDSMKVGPKAHPVQHTIAETAPDDDLPF